MTEEPEIRILIADPHSLFREAVRTVIDSEPGVTVVAEAGDGINSVSQAERWRPDIALLDADLPNCDSLRATSMIRERVPECRVCILDGTETEATLIRAVESGASGYLTKDAPLAQLIEATRAIHSGETLIPRHMLGSLLASLTANRRKQDEAHRLIVHLTKREKEVLLLLSSGADNDGIAERLVISPQTARTHIQNVLYKLGVHSRLEAAAFVNRNGLESELEAVSA